MKSLRLMVPAVVILALAMVAFGQSVAPKTDAQKSFEAMKELAGNWEGKVTVAEHSEMNNMGGHVSFRVTSMGNALVHEMQGEGRPDHPMTMFYLEAGGSS